MRFNDAQAEDAEDSFGRLNGLQILKRITMLLYPRKMHQITMCFG